VRSREHRTSSGEPALRCGKAAAAGLGGRGGTVTGIAQTATKTAVEHDLGQIAAEWDELADRTRAVPFLRPGWIGAWWDAFGHGALEILTLRRGRRLAGALPVYDDQGRLRSPTNDQTPQFGLVAEDAAAANELAAALLDRAARRVTVALVDASGWDLAALRDGAEARGYHVLAHPIVRPPYLIVDRDWEAFEGRIAGRLLRDLRRRRRRLEDNGVLTLDVADGTTGLEDLLTEGFRVETSGWKAAQRTAIVSRPETRHFFTEIARWASSRGWLRLAFLRLDGRAIAFQLGLEEGGAYYLLKGGYDSEFHRYAPGKLLVHEMLQSAFSSGLERFEFLGQAEPWKLEWTHDTRVLLLVDAFAPSLRGRAQWAAHSVHHSLRGLGRRAKARLATR
jgi:CelD/BcsL family acetyltransferase involved in cellulose biosynthesis